MFHQQHSDFKGPSPSLQRSQKQYTEQQQREYFTNKVNPIFEPLLFSLIKDRPQSENLLNYTIKWLNKKSKTRKGSLKKKNKNHHKKAYLRGSDSSKTNNKNIASNDICDSNSQSDYNSDKDDDNLSSCSSSSSSSSQNNLYTDSQPSNKPQNNYRHQKQLFVTIPDQQFHRWRLNRLTNNNSIRNVRTAISSQVYGPFHKRAVISLRKKLKIQDENVEMRILFLFMNSFLFNNFNEEQKRLLIENMSEKHVEEGEVVIKEGQYGNQMFFVVQGQFECFKEQSVRIASKKYIGSKGEDDENKDEEENQNQNDDNDHSNHQHNESERDFYDLPQIHRVKQNNKNPTTTTQSQKKKLIKLKTYKPGDIFGQLCILHNSIRLTTIKAKVPSFLYSINRQVYRHIKKLSIVKKRTLYTQTMRKVNIFENIPKDQLQKICDVLEEITYEPGKNVIVQGEKGNKFYIVLQGVLIAHKSPSSPSNPSFNNCQPSSQQPLSHQNTSPLSQVSQCFKQGDYFGQLALLHNQPRQATVKTVTKCVLVYLTQDVFKRIIDREKIEKEIALKYNSRNGSNGGNGQQQNIINSKGRKNINITLRKKNVKNHLLE